MNKDIFFSLDKILSYNSLLNFLIGERGVGKSYSLKKFVANRFIKKHKQFVYIRRYKTELKSAMMKNSTPIFFEQILNDSSFKNHKLSNSIDTMYIDDVVAGFAVPLSNSNILKSSSFENVDTIIFDEFIIDKGCYHYLQNEVIQFLDLIETIARLRNIRVFLLGNAISITNPYFLFFNISLPYNSQFKTFNNNLITLQYIQNIKYRKVKKSTRFGQLIKDTEYGKYAIDNNFLRDSKTFLQKKPAYAKFFFTIIINKKYIGIWNDYKNDNLYISYSYDPNCPVIFSINSNDHNENTILLRTRLSPFFKSLVTHYTLAKLFFETPNIKNSVLPYIIKSLSY